MQSNNGSTNILGVRIDLLSIKEINQIIITQASQKYHNPIVVFKPYVEFLSLAAKNQAIKNLLNSSDYNVADSTAVQWAASYLAGQPKIGKGYIPAYYSILFRMRSKQWSSQIVPEKMAGIDQTQPLLALASKNSMRIGIIGGPKDTQKTKHEVSKLFKGLEVYVWTGYYDSSDEADIVKDIAANNLDILFCAMGFPKQEKFIIKYKNKLRAKVLIGEGGSFDYKQLGGNVKRAPLWMQRIGLEWLWRLILQQSRIRRQFAIPAFIKNIKKEKLTNK